MRTSEIPTESWRLDLTVQRLQPMCGHSAATLVQTIEAIPVR